MHRNVAQMGGLVKQGEIGQVETVFPGVKEDREEPDRGL